MSKIVLATGNQGKVREMADLLSDFGFEVLAQSEFNVSEVAETGTTFIENAIIKAPCRKRDGPGRYCWWFWLRGRRT